MKAFMILMSFLVTPLAMTAPVDGKLFYTLPSGEIVKRVVTLEVPSRGQGEVVLSGKSFEWRSTDFKTIKKNGKTTFIVAFKTQFRQFKSTIVLKGSYVKATNKILYYGDTYKMKGHTFVDGDLTGFSYNGGFKFEYDL